MIIQPQPRKFENFDTQSFISIKKLMVILKNQDEFKEDLIKIFKIKKDKPSIIKIGNSKFLINSILNIDENCKKIDLDILIKDIYLKKMLEAEKAEFEIFNIKDTYIKKKTLSDILVAETAYSAKIDLLDIYSLSKFANYCRDNEHEDLLNHIKEYLKINNAQNTSERKLRLIHKFDDSKFYIRAITSTNVYKDFGINFSVFVALISLNKHVETSEDEIYIDKYKISESQLFVSFAFKRETIINDNLKLSFNLILENDEIKRNPVAFNGVFRLKWEYENKKSEIYLKPDGVKKSEKSKPVDLLKFYHKGNVQGVFDNIHKLPELIDFFINQVKHDAKKISEIKHPNDIKNLIADKVRNSRKAEFKKYKSDILSKLMNINVSSTFLLFELLRDVEELFEHDDVISINFWRTKLYNVLINKK